MSSHINKRRRVIDDDGDDDDNDNDIEDVHAGWGERETDDEEIDEHIDEDNDNDEEEDDDDEEADLDDEADADDGGLIDDEAQEAELDSDDEEVGSDEEDLDEDEDDAAEDTAINHIPIAKQSSKPERRVQHAFAQSLIEQAAACNWEAEDLARVLALVLRELDYEFRTEKLYNFLSECSVGGIPTVLQRLSDEMTLALDSTHLGLLIFKQASNDCASDRHDSLVNRFVYLMEEACEQHLFDLSDTDVIRNLYDIAKDTCEFDYEAMRRFAVSLCSHSASKKVAGRVLRVFTESLPATRACLCIYEIVQLDFFLDLRGNMKDMYNQLGSIKAEVEAYVEANHDINSDGDLVDSDEDADGNLRGFVVDEESGGGSEEGESGGGSEEGESGEGEETDQDD